MTKHTAVTPKQEMLIVDFVKTAKLNGAGLIFAALPSKHCLMESGKGVQMKQIRVVRDELAGYSDELGNTISLTAAGLVKQH